MSSLVNCEFYYIDVGSKLLIAYSRQLRGYRMTRVTDKPVNVKTFLHQLEEGPFTNFAEPSWDSWVRDRSPERLHLPVNTCEDYL